MRGLATSQARRPLFLQRSYWNRWLGVCTKWTYNLIIIKKPQAVPVHPQPDDNSTNPLLFLPIPRHCAPVLGSKPQSSSPSRSPTTRTVNLQLSNLNFHHLRRLRLLILSFGRPVLQPSSLNVPAKPSQERERPSRTISSRKLHLAPPDGQSLSIGILRH